MAHPEGTNPEESREMARTLHRAGRLAEARAAYERLLAAAPGDPDLMGLLGVLALQEQRPGEAERLLGAALDAAHADPRIHLRNLNNLFAVLKQGERTEAARALAASEAPVWPGECAPNARERVTVLSLAEALAMFDQPARALALLDSALPRLGEDVEALTLLGRLRLLSGDARAALSDLQRVLALEPENWEALAALSAAHGALNDAAAAREAAGRFARAAPIYLAPGGARQQATILALNGVPTHISTPHRSLHELHFATNYISQLSHLLAEEFRFASVFADLPGDLPRLPTPDVVFNNIASAEHLNAPGRLDRLLDVLAPIDRPVINHPAAVTRMTRQKAAELLEGIPGLRIPTIRRYWRDLARFDEIERDIAGAFAYPLIVRHVAVDESSGSLDSEQKSALLVHDREALRAFLERVDWPQFYAIEYVDLRRPDGNFRKVRAAFLPDDIIISHAAFYDQWMVAGRHAPAEKGFYGRFPHLVAEVQRLHRNPEEALGVPVMSVLEAVRSRVPLELFGMDFDVDRDGRIVLFEVQATMIFDPPPGMPEELITPENDARVAQGFRRLVHRKISGAG